MNRFILCFALLTALALPGRAVFARNWQGQSGQASQQQPPANSAPGPNDSSSRKTPPPDITNAPGPNESSSRKSSSDQPEEPEPGPEEKSKSKKSDNYDPFPAVKDVEVGEFYMRKGDLDAAISRFEEAIRLRPNYAQPRLLLAQIYERKGEKDQAVKYYREYLQVYPHAPDAKKIEKKIEKLSNEKGQ